MSELKNIFDKEVSQGIIERIDNLTTSSKAEWGKMNVAQMLAHLNIQYEVVYENGKFPKPNIIARFFLKVFVKKTVTGPKPFVKNGRTAPYFMVTDEKEFETEKLRLKKYITITQANGVEILLKRETKSFGKLTTQEWNNLFYKHLNHHLVQFNV